jgi:phosphoserine phosphatase RsbU/P
VTNVIEQFAVQLTPAESQILADLLVLVAYTDGLTDTVNDRDEQYGDSRLAGAINNAPVVAQDILTHILQDLEAFAGPVPRPDDVTLLILTAD